MYNSYLEQLENQKTDQLKIKRLQIQTDILLKDFKALIRKIINKIKIFKYTIDSSLIRLWKRDPLFDTNDKLRDHLYKSCVSSKTLDYQISNNGELLDKDDTLPLNLILAEGEPLVVEINEPGKLWIFFNEKIKAYKKCDYCGKMDSSEYSCSCGRV